MSHRICFTVSDSELPVIEYEAKARGMTRSQLAKTALFSHINKYPSKGVMAEVHRVTSVSMENAVRPTFVGSHSDSDGVEQ